VQGNVTIDAGAHLTGQVRAQTVVVGGELHGNIEGAARVELLDTGVLAGDVKAGSLTVAAGSRMRGQVEFGWSEQAARSIKGEAAAS
jgi:cytoskeletal protein CcmA (bactofilin family)